MPYKANWNILPKPENMSEYEEDGISLPIAYSLYQRGVRAKKAKNYLKAGLGLLSSPNLIPHMQKACERIFQAIKTKEKIFIQGDYDCDGMTSALLIEWVLKSYQANVEIFIPNRLIYDYGITTTSIKYLQEKGASLIITVDCGINAKKAVDFANLQNIDIIITDHHTPQFTSLPKAFCIINPLLNPDKKQLHTLAGVGVAFKLCHGFVLYTKKQGIKNDIDLRYGLDLVAFGTIADFCPIIDDNRIIIKNGLTLINKKCRVGLQALINTCKIIGKVDTNQIVKILAPKINTTGRLGCPEIAIELLSTQDYTHACKLIRQINKYNKKRQDIEHKVYKKAFRLAQEEAKKNKKIIIVIGHNWHPGVIGGITNRLTNIFSLPCLVLNKLDKDNDYFGSGRSGSSRINLLNIISKIDTEVECGGHKVAFGICVAQQKVDSFVQKVYNNFSTFHDENPPKLYQKTFDIDGVVDLQNFDENFQLQYKDLGPFSLRTTPPNYLTKIKFKNFKKSSKTQITGYIHHNKLEFFFKMNTSLIDQIDLDKNYLIVFNIIPEQDNFSHKIIIKDIVAD